MKLSFTIESPNWSLKSCQNWSIWTKSETSNLIAFTVMRSCQPNTIRVAITTMSFGKLTWSTWFVWNGTKNTAIGLGKLTKKSPMSKYIFSDVEHLPRTKEDHGTHRLKEEKAKQWKLTALIRVYVMREKVQRRRIAEFAREHETQRRSDKAGSKDLEDNLGKHWGNQPFVHWEQRFGEELLWGWWGVKRKDKNCILYD